MSRDKMRFEKFKPHPLPSSPLKRGRIKVGGLPQAPGVYFFKDKSSQVIYIGKAANLRRRVSSYWQKKSSDPRLIQLISEVLKIDFRTTPTVIEALILEAELIKKYQPKFNVREKDNKSFLYVTFTKEKFPKPFLVRGKEVEKLQATSYKLQASYGPFVQANSIRAALRSLRKIFPYSTCESRSKNQELRIKPCFDYQIGLCPGMCIDAISHKDYMKNIRNLILFFRGKKQQILRDLKDEMKKAAKIENFEQAAKLRNQIFALEHIRDTALLTRDRISTRSSGVESPLCLEPEAPGALRAESRFDSDTINIFGRIEGYDISNISGTAAVGSMVVFQNGEPAKSEYRKFKIKTIKGANDVGMLREIFRRRFHRIKNRKLIIKEQQQDPNSLFINHHSWQTEPNLIVIDGGKAQVNAAREVLKEYNLNIPVIGIAKGLMRKQNKFIIESEPPSFSASWRMQSAPRFGLNQRLELAYMAQTHKDLLLQIRDEAHRFAISYHRKLRSQSFIPPL